MIPSNPNPMYLPLRNENLCAHKNLYINIYRSSVHNCQKLEIIQMFCNGYIHTTECNSVIKKKGACCWYPQLAWISKALCWVKEGNLKSWHTVWFHLYGLLDKTKLKGWRIGKGLPSVRPGDVTTKGQHWCLGDDGTALSPYCGGSYTNLCTYYNS